MKCVYIDTETTGVDPKQHGIIQLSGFITIHGDNYYGSYFYSPALCIMNLAGWHLAAERSLLENFKLGTVAKFLGIKTSEGALHDGLYDIELAYKIEQVLNNLKTQHI